MAATQEEKIHIKDKLINDQEVEDFIFNTLLPNLPCSIKKLNNIIRNIYDGIPEYQEQHNGSNKGAKGMEIEEYIFGNKPNNDSNPDIENSYEIKSTALSLNNDNNPIGFKVKERIKNTSIGGNRNNDRFRKTLTDEFINKNSIEETEYSKKTLKQIIVITHYKKKCILTDILTIIIINPFDNNWINNNPYYYQDIMPIIDEDFQKLSIKCESYINTNNFDDLTQRNQEYLHFTSSGQGHGVKERSLAWKHDYLFKILSNIMYLKMNIPLEEILIKPKGCSIYYIKYDLFIKFINNDY